MFVGAKEFCSGDHVLEIGARVSILQGGPTTWRGSQVAAGWRHHRTLCYGEPWERLSCRRFSAEMMMTIYKNLKSTAMIDNRYTIETQKVLSGIYKKNQWDICFFFILILLIIFLRKKRINRRLHRCRWYYVHWVIYFLIKQVNDT